MSAEERVLELTAELFESRRLCEWLRQRNEDLAAENARITNKLRMRRQQYRGENTEES